MFGDVFGFPIIKGIGLASSASPAPKVFTAHKGFETYANRFYIEYTNLLNEIVSVEITPQIYQKLQGPYNRRNMYGAATSYGPVLISNPLTKDMLTSVLHYAFCKKAPLLEEFGIDAVQLNSPVKIKLKPIGHFDIASDWPLEFEASCDE